jgi:hypothetical protein
MSIVGRILLQKLFVSIMEFREGQVANEAQYCIAPIGLTLLPRVSMASQVPGRLIKNSHAKASSVVTAAWPCPSK